MVLYLRGRRIIRRMKAWKEKYTRCLTTKKTGLCNQQQRGELPDQNLHAILPKYPLLMLFYYLSTWLCRRVHATSAWKLNVVSIASIALHILPRLQTLASVPERFPTEPLESQVPMHCGYLHNWLFRLRQSASRIQSCNYFLHIVYSMQGLNSNGELFLSMCSLSTCIASCRKEHSKQQFSHITGISL